MLCVYAHILSLNRDVVVEIKQKKVWPVSSNGPGTEHATPCVGVYVHT